MVLRSRENERYSLRNRRNPKVFFRRITVPDTRLDSPLEILIRQAFALTAVKNKLRKYEKGLDE